MSEIVKEPTIVETKNCDNENGEPEHDPHYDPIITLPEVDVPTLEEDENVMLSLRAKLYRYDSNEVPAEWKERGTGNVKILHHKLNDTVRIVMRRDKTLKLCANHFITPYMNLKPSASCDRAWVYSAKDYSDATVKSEFLAIKFANIENALKWKEVFEEAKKIVAKNGDKKDANADDKIISTEPPKLNDTFEEDLKNSTSDKDKEKEKEKESDSLNKQANEEVAEKLSSMTIKEQKDS